MLATKVASVTILLTLRYFMRATLSVLSVLLEIQTMGIVETM